MKTRTSENYIRPTVTPATRRGEERRSEEEDVVASQVQYSGGDADLTAVFLP